jgi:hypothetical protein
VRAREPHHPARMAFRHARRRRQRGYQRLEALILDIAGQADSWSIIELFKRKLNPGCSTSSSESWAII